MFGPTRLPFSPEPFLGLFTLGSSKPANTSQPCGTVHARSNPQLGLSVVEYVQDVQLGRIWFIGYGGMGIGWGRGLLDWLYLRCHL